MLSNRNVNRAGGLHRRWILAAIAAIVCLTMSDTMPGQTNTPGKAVTATSAGQAYVQTGSLPALPREFLAAIGSRIQKPGMERLVLTGSYTDAGKSATAATVTWEAPGNLRFDTAGKAALVYNASSGVLNAAALPAADLEKLQSLLDDRPESFLYGFARGDAHRLLGAFFRTHDGKTPNFAGPWYDIYEAFVPVGATGAARRRQKYFCFDSKTKLFAQAAYVLRRGTALAKITTEYSGWTVQNGQAVPGQIVRKENNSVVWTFKVNSAAIGPAVQDGIFSKP